MKLLVLSFYYPPDLSAGSFRTAALVRALLGTNADLEVEVMTTWPNRYDSYSSDAEATEYAEGLTIHRVKLPRHKSAMLDQAWAFLTFARKVLLLSKGKRYDLVYATSSRLVTGSLGAYLAKRLKSPLYLDIRDIFVDTIKDVLPRFAPIAGPLFGLVERWTVSAARSVNLVSGGFKDYFESRYPRQRFTFFTNGVDDEFVSFRPTQIPSINLSLPVVLYAGNIGEGQGLHEILPPLARRMSGQARFRVLGDGGRRATLEEALRRAQVDNVEILPPVSRERLLDEYAAADVLFLHLNDYDAFRKVLPSKIFEYAATGKPILAGLSGYSAEFARKEIENLAIFPPCDSVAAATALSELRLELTDRSNFIANYARTRIMRAMAADILSFGSGSDADNKQ